MGDGVLVYFGYPRAHEDDAERAVRAGLGSIDAVGRLEVKSVKLQARVGIATGLVVVGDLIGEGSAQEQSVVGETPNLAARFQALAERLQAERHLRLRYFCSPYHQDSALYPFVDQLGRGAGFARDDMPGARLEKLEAVLARAAPPEEDVAFFADLLSLPGSERHPL